MNVIVETTARTNQRRRLGLAAARYGLALAMLVLCGCGDETGDDSSGAGSKKEAAPPNSTTVTSADGQVQLTIPEGALPAGTTPADIQITPLPPVQGALVAGEQAWPMLAWNLAPDGLQLQKPATLTVSFDNIEHAGVPLAVHRSAAGDEHPNLTAEIDLVARTATVSSEISHFSTWFSVNMKHSPITLNVWVEGADAWQIGTGPVVGTRLAVPKQLAFAFEQDPLQITADAQGTLNVTGPVDPTLFPGMPSSLQSDIYSANAFPICVESGDATAPVWGVDLTLQHGDAYKSKTRVSVVGERGFTCLKPGEKPAPPCSHLDNPEFEWVLVPLEKLVQGAWENILEVHCPDPSIVSDLPTSNSNPSLPSKPGAGDHTEIAAIGTVRMNMTLEAANENFNNTEYPCGQGEHGFTICTDPPGEVVPGEYLVVFNVLNGPLPLSNDHYHNQYAFVFESDNNLFNNYQPEPPFSADFFKGTDLWYTAYYSHWGDQWHIEIDDLVNQQLIFESPARIIIQDNVIMLVAPASDFIAEQPHFRVSAFQHTGDWGQKPPYDWKGDVEPPVAGLFPFYLK